MNKPTKEQREKIDTAIDKIAALCSDGMDPSKAVAKVASAMKLTQDYLPIIVRAYNTGAAAIHREESNTLQEKAASYPIAYLDEVMSLLRSEFPMGKKASAPKVEDDFWDYPATVHFPDAWDYLKEEEEPAPETVKKAAAKPHQVLDAHKAVMNAADVAANEATRIKYAAQEERDKAYDDVVRELRKAGGIKPDVARKYAEVSYGEEGLKIINKMIAENYMDKKAQYQRETYIPDSHPFAQAFEKLVFKNEAFKKAAADEKAVLEQCVGIVNQYVRPKERYVEGMDSIDEMFKEAEIARKKKREQEYRTKQAYKPLSTSGVGGITGLEALNHPGWVGLDRFERELMYGLADPAHEAELRRIRVQSILIDLLNTDPYLKEKDPEEVIDAMNEILEINPDIHKNKPMLRVALRQFMESGGMDIPTLGVVSEFGKEERQRKAQERSQAISNAIQFANQAESARTQKEIAQAANELKAKLQKEEQEFKHKETVEERNARELEAKRERRFRTAEREAGQEFTRSEREAGEDFRRRERELGQDFTTSEREAGEAFRTSERLAGEAVQKELAELQRDLQKSEGQENRQVQRDISANSIASQKEIAEKQRELQEREGKANRELQANEGDANRLWQRSNAMAALAVQKEIAEAQRELQKSEGDANRKVQVNEGEANRLWQRSNAMAALKVQKDLAEERNNLQKQIEEARLQQDINKFNDQIAEERARAEQEYNRRIELEKQRQEFERQLAAANARTEALREMYNDPDDAAQFQNGLPGNDLLAQTATSYNLPYTTRNAKTVGFNTPAANTTYAFPDTREVTRIEGTGTGP